MPVAPAGAGRVSHGHEYGAVVSVQIVVHEVGPGGSYWSRTDTIPAAASASAVTRTSAPWAMVAPSVGAITLAHGVV